MSADIKTTVGQRVEAPPHMVRSARERSTALRHAMSLLALSIVVTLLAFTIMLAQSKPALAAECPVKGDSDTIAAAIRQSPSCDRAVRMFQDCEFGSSGDVALGEAVRERCEEGFLHALTRTQKASYEKKQRYCENKYAKESGTMYRSFEAFCGAYEAQRYNHKYGKRP